jgi:hypothetical protein
VERIIRAIFQLVFADDKMTLVVVAVIVAFAAMMLLASASGHAAGQVLTSAISR